MTKKLYVKTENGVDSLLKVVSTLRRKEFDIVDVLMQGSVDSDVSHLYITIDESNGLSSDVAVSHMEKLYGVSDIKMM